MPRTAEEAFGGAPPAPDLVIGRAEIEALYDAYRPSDDRLDVVVFAAPQLSLHELAKLAGLLEGKRVHANVALVVCTSPEMKAAARRKSLLISATASFTALTMACVTFGVALRTLPGAPLHSQPPRPMRRRSSRSRT